MIGIPSLFIVAIALALSLPVAAQNEKSTCADKDPSRHVAGGRECLVYKAFGLEAAGKTPLLFVFLHGDVSAGGPGDYMYGYAEKYARPGVVGVALLRPGYYDAEGNRSTGHDNGRADNYTAHNVDAIADAIGRLRDRFSATRVVLLGHSGGAAVAGVILGRHPGLASGAVLVSCPCDLQQWAWDRQWKRGAYQSLSPHSFGAQVAQGTRVFTISGERDDVVFPHLSQKYATSLSKRGIRAEYREIPNGTHRFNTLATSPLFSEVVVLLLEDVLRLSKE